ncbi:xylulokinase [Mucilaginibacter phyllosphaerae]|uniref:Carbohydrate kinase n=1 Tax=Mucilaginibacter phyllosphaerae TaxID=1812349 RepID=A0A4Y8ADN5_9SPHI|nr:FGGY family carbohydrate kinase [Mucilaginibacter phyllosphaerae]MBB3970351.1 xylulokinase [Mucilaginibacter phyllosphaerae]TEW66720.1 carbohydrate kinase [Mucilaginibacter phyllosphaerae]GGH11467.1 carbohydrate kinase [Mucilaginibacter phyllosphaerae]
MLLLGIDIGTSSVKVCVVDAENQSIVASAQFPDQESPILSLRTGWAEQSPDMWWQQTQQAIGLCHKKGGYNPKNIAAIGIAYQMHGLVLVDKEQKILRNSIIWCDSRGVEIGEKAFADIGTEACLSHMLNSPGNFTASKLAWVKQNEPEIYKQIDKIMLPGDYIAMKLTGEITTSASALSEGIFFDFQFNGLSKDITDYFGFSDQLFPTVKPVFSAHGRVTAPVASQLELTAGIPVTYKAGDQPNNALSLNVLKPGEVAATAGTSGVIYGVSDQLAYDPQSRVNTFAHVNYSNDRKRLGVLLCINGTGSLYRWVKNTFGGSLTYQQMNAEAAKAPLGSDGLRILPFGNGAERMLNNKQIGAHLQNIDLNLHTPAHIFRAAQEGIACAFRYGLDIMRENGMHPTVIRAGKTNMFLSDLFAQTFVDATGIPVELYNNDGSLGAALGAGIGAEIYSSQAEAFSKAERVGYIEPADTGAFEAVYQDWKSILEKHLEEV